MGTPFFGQSLNHLLRSCTPKDNQGVYQWHGFCCVFWSSGRKTVDCLPQRPNGPWLRSGEIPRQHKINWWILRFQIFRRSHIVLCWLHICIHIYICICISSVYPTKYEHLPILWFLTHGARIQGREDLKRTVTFGHRRQSVGMVDGIAWRWTLKGRDGRDGFKHFFCLPPMF